jgi:plasmid stabilization system protein ParE
MVIRWTTPALEDAKNIVSHIGDTSFELAAEIAQGVLESINRLLIFPVWDVRDL